MSCVAPFLPESDYNNSKGFVDGRFCSTLTGVSCCLPCPVTDWVYPESFTTLGTAVAWVAVVSALFCIMLLVSWAVLPVDKTHRHYLSICLTSGVFWMNLGFIIPLAGRPDQCEDAITPNSMHSSSTCAASGVFLILGGWCGIMWVFLRSLSLHLQICWQVVVGRRFMWLSHATGWGLPVLGTVLAVVFSGVSFRFGATCHINHRHSLAVLWIPLLVFSGLTIVVQLVTFTYCIKVYLAALADNTASTENSGLPSYSNSIHTLTPRQAYRRVRRVIQLQWRGIAIVIIIVTDVIFFSIVFVFQDHTTQTLKEDPASATDWLLCLVRSHGDKMACLDHASGLAVSEATVGAVLVLLAMNGFWLLLLLGRWSMVHGWIDLLTPASRRNNLNEFVSVDARLEDLKKDTRSYEMLSRERDGGAGSGGGGGGGGGGAAGGGAATGGVLTIDIAEATLAAAGDDKTTSRITSASTTTSSLAGTSQRHAPRLASLKTNTDSWTMMQSPTAAAADSAGASGGASGGASPVNYYADAMRTRTISPPPPAVRSVSRTASHTSHGSGHGGGHARYGSRGTSQDRLGSLGGGVGGGVGGGGQTGGPPGGSGTSGRRTPDYFVQTARYNAPARSFSMPRPSTANSTSGAGTGTGAGSSSPSGPGGVRREDRTPSRQTAMLRGSPTGYASPTADGTMDDRHPLGMNRI